MIGSLRAYAKHRKSRNLSGGSLSAVQKAVKNQRITLESDGTVDFDRANAEWAANSDLTKRRGDNRGDESGAGPVVIPDNLVVSNEFGETPEGITHSLPFAEAQRRREWIRVDKDQLDLSVKRQELAPVAQVNAWVAGMIMRAREILLAIGPELQDRLAQETVPAKCGEMVTAEVHRALRELTEYRPAANA